MVQYKVMTCPCRLTTQCRLINSDDSLVSQLKSIYVQLVSTLVGLIIIQLGRIGIGAHDAQQR